MPPYWFSWHTMRTPLPDRACHRTCVALMLVSLLAPGCATTAAQDPRLIEDAQTLARIRSAVVNDPELGLRPIEIRVRSGVVQLSGRVGSEDEARRLIALVRGLGGVTAVESEVKVVPESTLAAPVVNITDPGDTASDRRFLAVGVALGYTNPRDVSLGSRLSLGSLFRIGSGTGLAPTVAFNWTTVELLNDVIGAQPIGRIRLRPVMGGVGYTWSGVRTSATLSLVAGYSFNSLSIGDVSPGQALVVGVDDSFAGRPGFSVWYDMNARLALNVFTGYLIARPRITVLDDVRVDTRTLRADTAVVRVGMAYKLF